MNYDSKYKRAENLTLRDGLPGGGRREIGWRYDERSIVPSLFGIAINWTLSTFNSFLYDSIPAFPLL